MKHGKGTYADEKYKYTGNWKEGKKHGAGRLEIGNEVHIGNWVENKLHGFENGNSPNKNKEVIIHGPNSQMKLTKKISWCYYFISILFNLAFIVTPLVLFAFDKPLYPIIPIKLFHLIIECHYG